MTEVPHRRAGWWRSLAVRLALGYLATTILAMMVGSFLFYDGTIGVLSRDMDAALRAVSTRLSNTFQSLGGAAGQVELQILLNDDQEVDTEV